MMTSSSGFLGVRPPPGQIVALLPGGITEVGEGGTVDSMRLQSKMPCQGAARFLLFWVKVPPVAPHTFGAAQLVQLVWPDVI